jgi:ABC-2 type transport system permease protein
MKALATAEWLKLRSTRMAPGMLLGLTALVLLVVVLTVASLNTRLLAQPLGELNFYLLASMAIVLFAFILGIRGFTDEFRYGTITTSVLVTPRRGRLVAAKILTFAIGGVVLAVVAEAAMVGAAIPMSSAKGVDLSLSSGDLRALGGLVLAAGLWAVIGVGLGAVVRHQVAAVVGGLVWLLVVENFATAVAPGLAPFLPGRAATALAQVSGQDLLAPWPGGLVLAAYALIGGGAGWIAFRRGDVGARL